MVRLSKQDKAIVAQATEMGRDAFAKRVGRAPAMNDAFMETIATLDHAVRVAAMKAYIRAFDAAMLASQ